MFEKIKPYFNKTMPNYLSWTLLTLVFILTIFLSLNLLKLSEFKGNQYLFEPKYTLTKTWCKLTGGYFIENTRGNYLANHKPPKDFKCTPPYADENSPCEYSNQCQGACLANVPTIENYTNSSQIKFDGCIKQEDSESQYGYTLNFSCPHIKLEGKCSEFKWQRNPELNGNTIMFHIFSQALDI